jgi:hypothetical protein
VIGESFEQAWQVYAEQRAARAQTADTAAVAFFAREPCADPPGTRLEALRTALDNRSNITREFASGNFVIYRIR